MKPFLIFSLLLGNCLIPVAAQTQNYVSKVWVADQGDGTYKNPILYADYSDPDVCRVGDDYYMTSSSFGCLPGLQILHSKDLVNWTIAGVAVPRSLAPHTDVAPQHGNRVWAPCIRHHNGEFYIFWGDPDQGIFMTKAKDVKGPWIEPVLVKAAKGIIDTTPLWDDDGRVYLAHAFAGSRAGLKSVIAVCELNSEATQTISPSRIVFDGHEAHQTCEGPKFYKRNGYYYIFHPAGGVPTGWQVVLRSKDVYGPYEWRTVLAQGKSPVNGPHQGGWVDTPSGEDWFIHFQDVGAAGRLVHLQPMKWINDWPVIGEDKDGDGCGEPVLTYKKPDVGKTYPICTPQESDEFDSNELGLQWQFNGNIDDNGTSPTRNTVCSVSTQPRSVKAITVSGMSRTCYYRNFLHPTSVRQSNLNSPPLPNIKESAPDWSSWEWTTQVSYWKIQKTDLSCHKWNVRKQTKGIKRL